MTVGAWPSTLPALLAPLATGVEWEEARMAEWGRALGAALPRGAVLALHGDLGAGKTTLVRAIADGLGVHHAAEVTSPTYAVVHEYETAQGAVVHADLYRLRRPAELDELGWEELVAHARAVVVEWPEQGGDRLPPHTVHLRLSHVPGAAEVRALQHVR